jgi:hypothetical protein
MRYFLIVSLIFLNFSSFAGEFSKIDLSVREALESHYSGTSLDIFEDITALSLEQPALGCLLVVSAVVTLDQETVKEFLCVNKVNSEYESTVIEK